VAEFFTGFDFEISQLDIPGRGFKVFEAPENLSVCNQFFNEILPLELEIFRNGCQGKQAVRFDVLVHKLGLWSEFKDFLLSYLLLFELFCPGTGASAGFVKSGRDIIDLDMDSFILVSISLNAFI